MDNMTRDEVLEKTIKVIHDCAPELANMELKEDTVVNTDMAIDSMGFILIICKLEGLFDVRIPERQWQKLSTLGDVVDAVMKRLPEEK
jgi:acyl carrier protein